VLRDAYDKAPHKKEGIGNQIISIADNPKQGETLLWFFNKGFSFRLTDRFQELDDFIIDLKSFSDSEEQPQLNLLKEYKSFDQNIKSRDRGVQLASLTTSYKKLSQEIDQTMLKSVNYLSKMNGNLSIHKAHKDNLNNPEYPDIGDFINPHQLKAYTITRADFNRAVTAIAVPFGVGMEIHLYATSFIAQSQYPTKNEEPLVWTKVVEIEESTTSLEGPRLTLIADALQEMLARALRKLSHMPEDES